MKKKSRRTPLFAIRVDGGVHLGMGHLFKMSIIAKQLKKKRPSLRIEFFVKRDLRGYEWLKKQGFLVKRIPSSLSRAKEPTWLIEQLGQDVDDATIAIDILDVSKAYVERLTRRGLRVITFENRAQSNQVADLTINALVEGPKNRVQKKGSTVLLKGANYRVFHPDYGRVKPRRLVSTKGKKTILVTLGGGSDKDYASIVIDTLLSQTEDTKLIVVAGPAMQSGLKKKSRDWKNRVKVLDSQRSLAKVMQKSDLAITAGGGTLYEFALMGVPAIAFAKVGHQMRNITAFGRQGTLINGGSLNQKNIYRAIKKVNWLLESPKERMKISKAGKKLVDGKGTKRVVQKLVKVIKGEK